MKAMMRGRKCKRRAGRTMAEAEGDAGACAWVFLEWEEARTEEGGEAEAQAQAGTKAKTIGRKWKPW
jgi:hypothetical protein